MDRLRVWLRSHASSTPVWYGHLFQIPAWLVFCTGSQSTSRADTVKVPSFIFQSWVLYPSYVKVNTQTGISNWTGGFFFPPIAFPQWVIAAGPNKEREMRFNGVHKSAFPCCQVRATHAASSPSPAPPRVCNLVKLQCFQSCLLWELWFLMSSSTVVFRSRLLLGNVSILFYLDRRGPGLICQHWQEAGGVCDGLWLLYYISPQRAPLH